MRKCKSCNSVYIDTNGFCDACKAERRRLRAIHLAFMRGEPSDFTEDRELRIAVYTLRASHREPLFGK